MMKSRILTTMMLLFVVLTNPVEAQRARFEWVKCYQGYQERLANGQQTLDNTPWADITIETKIAWDPNEITGTLGYIELVEGDTIHWVGCMS